MTQTEPFGKITNYEIADTPIPMTTRERGRKYAASAKGKRTRRDWKHANVERPFVMWDGEGITVENNRHLYTLFASSTGRRIQDDAGLRTRDIFTILLSEKVANPTAINVVYGASYDFNMWLGDLSRETLDKLYEQQSCYWQEFRLSWRRGKSFRITNRETGITITVYDVVSFFQCAFVKACDDYLGDQFLHRDMIVANKAARGSFTVSDNATVEEYNDAELNNGVRLMNELRARLDKVGLRPSRWDGPGAIATALLSREGIKNAMGPCPKDVAHAARFGYAGGRFEVIRCGNVEGKAYEYDINSAYPSALRHVPNLHPGQGIWIHTRSGELPDTFTTFGIYRASWHGEDANISLPQPFFCRAGDGTVAYPQMVTGWYWAPEIVTAQAYADKYGGELIVHEGWEYVPSDPDDKPFAFIEPMYLKRQALKKAGDGAHVGLKLGLNSLYGKTCQKVGAFYDPHKGVWKTPPFHQLEWAGYVTSHCRASVLFAALESLESIIAFETDALFSTTPLSVETGSYLGQWEYTEFDHLCYVQSGFYFGRVDGLPFSKTRGVDRGSMTFEDVKDALSHDAIKDRYAEAQLTRFIGIGLARQLNDFTRWRTWETTPKHIQLDPQGKRVHEYCVECMGDGLTPNVWHYTYPPFGGMQISQEYPIPWINPNPDMSNLDDWHEQRREDMAADYE